MSILAALQKGVKTTSAEGTTAVGRGLAREMAAGGVVALYGDLGAGKTTFVRGIAEALGYHDITSPSFNYYFLYQAQGRRTLVHLDAYRLKSPSDYPSLMVDELLTKEALFVVEWPEKLGDYLPASAYRIYLEGRGDERTIRLEK